jgi:hypothetical protein
MKDDGLAAGDIGVLCRDLDQSIGTNKRRQARRASRSGLYNKLPTVFCRAYDPCRRKFRTPGFMLHVGAC